MTKTDSKFMPIGRRNLFKLAGAAGTILSAAPVITAAEVSLSARAAAATGSGKHAYWFLNSAEQRFVEAAVDTLIPHDDTGPGALELNVAAFIDLQLASGYGKGDRLYLEGPFATGTPEQGYQLALTHAAVFRNGMADLRAYLLDKNNMSFDQLPPKDRVTVLKDLEAGKIELQAVPSKLFFGLLLQLTIEGYFSDPMYGGNKDAASWKMIGFPGADAMYMDKIEPYRNKHYVSEPKGIPDLV